MDNAALAWDSRIIQPILVSLVSIGDTIERGEMRLRLGIWGIRYGFLWESVQLVGVLIGC